MLVLILLVLGGVIISMAIGTVWHMPGTPGGNIHMRAIGFDQLSKAEQEAKMKAAQKTMPLIFAGQGVLSAFVAFAVVMIMSMSMANGMTGGAALSFVLFNWLCFMVPVLGGNILWGNYPSDVVWKKFISDALYNLVTLVAIGVMVWGVSLI